MPADIKDALFRAAYMVLFMMISYALWFLIIAIAVFQFGYALFMKQINKNLQDFGNSLSLYMYEITSFITYNTDKKPYPFSVWPKRD